MNPETNNKTNSSPLKTFSIVYTEHNINMGLCNFCLALPEELFDRSGDKVCKVSHQVSYHSLEASATYGCELCKLLLDAIRRGFWINVSSLKKESPKEAFSLRSDAAGQYFEIGNRNVGMIDGRRVPDGWGAFESICQSGIAHESL